MSAGFGLTLRFISIIVGLRTDTSSARCLVSRERN
jgi:hypothetical protein